MHGWVRLKIFGVLSHTERTLLRAGVRVGVPVRQAPRRASVCPIYPCYACVMPDCRNPRPMQYYISGTIVFLVIEMLAQFAYYRYINKNGGGAASIAFLFVIAILNAARNSLSFFLLLIVSMGLSVVSQSLGGIMGKIRVLTAFHFIFGGRTLAYILIHMLIQGQCCTRSEPSRSSWT